MHESVTTRVNSIVQPDGGYIPISQFERIRFNDGKSLNNENIAPTTMGLVVDYLTRANYEKIPRMFLLFLRFLSIFYSAFFQ